MGQRAMSVTAVVEHEKLVVARAAAAMVESGMILGLGTGSTVAYLLPVLAALTPRCALRDELARDRARGTRVGNEGGICSAGQMPPRTGDLAIDGADQVAPSGWLVKGGGAAHTREKALAAAADTVRRDRILEQTGRAPGAADSRRAARVRSRG